MAIDFSADLMAMLDGDFGVDVAFGALTTRGIFTRAGTILSRVGGLEVQAASDQLLIRDGTLPDLGQDSELTIDGRAYRVHEMGEVDDGGGVTVLVAEE